jgi:hypothetical protein
MRRFTQSDIPAAPRSGASTVPCTGAFGRVPQRGPEATVASQLAQRNATSEVLLSRTSSSLHSRSSSWLDSTQPAPAAQTRGAKPPLFDAASRGRESVFGADRRSQSRSAAASQLVAAVAANRNAARSDVHRTHAESGWHHDDNQGTVAVRPAEPFSAASAAAFSTLTEEVRNVVAEIRAANGDLKTILSDIAAGMRAVADSQAQLTAQIISTLGGVHDAVLLLVQHSKASPAAAPPLLRDATLPREQLGAPLRAKASPKPRTAGKRVAAQVASAPPARMTAASRALVRALGDDEVGDGHVQRSSASSRVAVESTIPDDDSMEFNFGSGPE